MNSLRHSWLPCKNLFIKPSPIINVVISASHARVSSVRRGRQKASTLWPNRLMCSPGKQMHWPGGQKYFGFVYYPRYPDQQEPEWEPSRLFMVTRRKPVAGNPFWLKRILRNLRIEQDNNEVAIVLNSEHMNRELWKIKHLVTITPITFPDGLPEEKDIDACRLYPNGELRFKSTLKIDPVRMNATEVFQGSLERIDKETINRYERKKWNEAYALLNDY